MTFRVSEIGMTHYATVEQEYEQKNLNYKAKKAEILSSQVQQQASDGPSDQTDRASARRLEL